MAQAGDRAIVDTILDEAAAAVQERDWSAALRLCEVAQRLDPDNRVALVLRSVCEEQLGRDVPNEAERDAPLPGRLHGSPAPTPRDALRGRPPAWPRPPAALAFAGDTESPTDVPSVSGRPVMEPFALTPHEFTPHELLPHELLPHELVPHDHTHDLDDALASVSAVSPFSPLTMRLISVLDDELASADDVARLASMDPVLTARILEVANSAYYRRRIRVATIKDAVMVLGAGEIRALVIGICVVGAMPPTEYIDHHAFWRFSMAVALLADLIARSEGDRSGEAFTAGVLHNVGLLVLDRYCPQGLRDVMELVASGRRRLHDREHLVFGFTDAEIGAALAQRWRLPPTVVQAIRIHGVRRDEVTEQNRAATALVRARIFARAQGMSDGLESSPPRNPGAGFLPARVQARLNAIGRWEDFLAVIDGLLAGAQAASEDTRGVG